VSTPMKVFADFSMLPFKARRWGGGHIIVSTPVKVLLTLACYHSKRESGEAGTL
jgi:hypothetical protein